LSVRRADGSVLQRSDRFRIRHWPDAVVLAALDRAGFDVAADARSDFAGTGASYYWLRKR
jgi:hypothetical protein